MYLQVGSRGQGWDWKLSLMTSIPWVISKKTLYNLNLILTMTLNKHIPKFKALLQILRTR